MKTIEKFKMGGGGYESPSLSIIDICSEGVLCASGADSLDRPDIDYDPWLDLGEI